jgi:hypothetical protein
MDAEGRATQEQLPMTIYQPFYMRHYNLDGVLDTMYKSTDE